MKKTVVTIALMATLCSFILATATIQVTYPNGNECLELGKNVNITWKSTSLTNNLKITLWKGGTFFGVIDADVDKNKTSYNWTVGQTLAGQPPEGTDYQIKIKEKSKTVEDMSDGEFSIKKKCGVTLSVKPGVLQRLKISVISPKTGSNWKEGETEVIKWQTSMKPPFSFELYNYSGKKKIRNITTGLQIPDGTNRYKASWHIPTDVYKWPGNYTIRISKGSLAGISEMFHISKAMKVKTYTFTATTVNKVKWHSHKSTDAFVAAVNPQAIDPGAGKIRVGYENIDSEGFYKGYIYRSWVHFNLSSLKGKGFITQATLTFHRFFGCDFTPRVYALDQPWSGAAGALFTVACSSVNPTANLAYLVNQWLAQDNNYGLVFVGLNESFPHNNSQCFAYFENVKLVVEIIEDVQ